MKLRYIFASAATALALAGSALVLAPNASADVPLPKAGNITVLPSGPRVVPSPGQFTQPVVIRDIKIAGETFGGQLIPANATGVVLSVSNNQSAGAGSLTVWTKGAGKPGTPTISWLEGKVATAPAFVGLDSDGYISVSSTQQTRYLLGISSFVTPISAPAAPVVKTIAATEKVLEKIGVSVRNDNPAAAGAGATDLGGAALEAGTYEINVNGGFKGLNSSTDLPAGVQLFGGLFVTNSATITSGFSEVLVQNQGVQIPRTTGTLTVDPTVMVTGQITLSAPTTVHVLAYAYAGDSVDHSALGLKANVRSATFTKVG